MLAKVIPIHLDASQIYIYFPFCLCVWNVLNLNSIERVTNVLLFITQRVLALVCLVIGDLKQLLSPRLLKCETMKNPPSNREQIDEIE